MMCPKCHGSGRGQDNLTYCAACGGQGSIEPSHVHILHHGVTLCGMLSVPRDWPYDHAFITIAQAHAGEAHAITCEPCGLSYNADYVLTEGGNV